MSVETLTKNNFEEVLSSSNKPVLVDFWASWCGPCRMLSPIVEQFAEEESEACVVGKVNVDEQPELAARFGIMSIPTLIVFKDSQPVQRSLGLISKAEIKALLG